MEPEPIEELLSISRALRVHLEGYRQTGALGLPRAPAGAFQEGPALERQTDDARERVPPAPDPLASPRAATAPVVSAPSRSTAPPAVAAPPPLTAPPAEARQVQRAPSLSRASPEERVLRLEQLREEVRGCTRCGLAGTRRNTVFARGDGSSGLCFVGEGPGADEDAQGLPFVGAAGQLLDKMIAAMGLSRDEVYVCNIVKCRPPENRKPEPREMAECMPYLTEQIELLQPQVIVALGATAVQGLLGTTEGIMRLRGKWKLYRGRIAVMPTFHPAYLLRTPAAKREVWDDLQAVLRQLGRPLPTRSR